MNDNKQVAVLEKKDHPVITADKIIAYLDSFGITSQLRGGEKTQFIEVAVAYQLDPFKREIYCVPYEGKNGRKLSIITGYEVYLKRAERTADLAGWSVRTEGSTKDGSLKAIITIHRKTWPHPFVHEVDFTEYNQGNYIWNSKPKTMIKKVGIAQAFRMAFPDEFGGMPYTADEVPVEMATIQEVRDIPKPEMPKANISKVAEAVAEPVDPEEAAIKAKAAEAKKRLLEGGEAPKPAPEATQTPPVEDKQPSVTGTVTAYKPPKGKAPAVFTVSDSDLELKTYDTMLEETIEGHMKNKDVIEVFYEKRVKGDWVNFYITGISVQA